MQKKIPRCSPSRLTGPFPPTFFRAAIVESSRSSYVSAGYTLAMHLRSLLKQDEEEEIVEERLDQALESEDIGEALDVLMKVSLPRLYALVPSRRKRTFLEGIVRAYEDGRME